MEKELIPFGQAVKRIEKAVSMIPARAGVIAVNFVKERFRQQNWLDKTPEPWKKRNPKKKMTKTDNRALLVKSGRLRRSFRKIVQGYRVIIATDVPYAALHNQGGTVQKSVNIASYTKKAYKRKGKRRTETVREHAVKSHSRLMNLTVEKRQFIGPSENLNERIEKMIYNDITNVLKEL